MLSVVGNIDPAELMTELRFENGHIFQLPTALFKEASSSGPKVPQDEAEGTAIVPIIGEELEISKRVVPTAQVRLQKNTETFDVKLDEPLTASSVRVERVALGHVVEVAPAVRLEGSTTVYPLLEERLILTKQLVLIEEVHVTPEFSERRDTQLVTLRRERLDVSREDVVGR